MSYDFKQKHEKWSFIDDDFGCEPGTCRNKCVCKNIVTKIIDLELVPYSLKYTLQNCKRGDNQKIMFQTNVFAFVVWNHLKS